MSSADTVVLPPWERADIGGFGPGLVMDVAGAPLWWASPDAPLLESPEAAVCLLAPWCALEGRTLQLRAPGPDPAFLRNVGAATTLMGSWWGHDPLRFVKAPASAGSAALAAPSPGTTALFFSGGIDSFYSLVRNPEIGVLVFIAGFDIRLRNRETWEAIVRSWRELAAEQGLRFIAVATNLRDHPVLGRMRWARYHGAVLAAATHLLRDEASRWLVSASYHVSNLMPWGSHPDLDHLWSGGGVQIIHYGAEVWRAEKLAAMADVPMVHRRLRVCYDDPRAEGNCGCCEKCVRTRLIYWQDLPGVACEGMPGKPGLAEALDAMPRLEMRTLVRIYRRFLERADADDPVTTALRALIIRSEAGSGI